MKRASISTVFSLGLIFFLGYSVFCLSLLKAEDWQNWKGPNYDGKSATQNLLPSWSEGGPKLLWQTDGLGNGYSNFSFYNNQMFTMGDIDGKSCLIALNQEDGSLLWKTEVGNPGGGGGYEGPRCTPTTDGKNVYAVNQFGNLICCDAKSGNKIWSVNYEDLGGKMMSGWGFAESPLLDGELLICTPGGENGTAAALDKTTGKIVWRSSDIKEPATYSSILPITLGGEKQYMLRVPSRVYGLEPKTGKILWNAQTPGDVAVATDSVFSDGYLFATCAYRQGGFGRQITKIGTRYAVKELYEDKNLANKHHGLIEKDGYVYTTTDRGRLVCFDLKTGTIQWQDRALGSPVSLAYADGFLILRDEKSGDLALVQANPKEYVESGRFEQPDRSDRNAWTYPLIIDGKMYIRDQGKLFCYQVAK